MARSTEMDASNLLGHHYGCKGGKVFGLGGERGGGAWCGSSPQLRVVVVEVPPEISNLLFGAGGQRCGGMSIFLGGGSTVLLVPR
jgi:hypothetical protein